MHTGDLFASAGPESTGVQTYPSTRRIRKLFFRVTMRRLRVIDQCGSC